MEHDSHRFGNQGNGIAQQILQLLQNSCSFIFQKIHLSIPSNPVEEMKQLCGLAGPLVISVTGLSVGLGLSSACDTLISQIFGGNNLKLIGIVMQRGLLVLLLACFPCWALFINTENILLLFKQDLAVARMAEEYVLVFIPALPAAFLYHLQSRYLQNQGIVKIQIIVSIISNIINALVNYVFLFVLELGVIGSAWANSIAQFSQALLLFLYIRLKKLHVHTWGGWSLECLQDWNTFVALAVPSMLMVCIEWWTYEIGSFLVGLLSVVELGAQSVIYQVVTIAYMIPYGIGMATSVRVGNALGAGDIEQAKKSMTIAFLITAFFMILDAILLGALKNEFSYIFTNDGEIATLVSEVIPIYIVFHVYEIIACVCSGILRGIGRQKIGAVIFAIGYYVLGLPVGAALMFAAKVGIKGLWIGMILCGVFLSVFFIIYLLKVSWQELSLEAQARAGMPCNERTPSAAKNTSDIIVLSDVSTQQTETKQLPLQEQYASKDSLQMRDVIVLRGLTLALAIAMLLIGIIIKVWISVK
ncbi:multidrug and toxin extrusion protein 2-like isoform X2 [Lithobates pipiens]